MKPVQLNDRSQLAQYFHQDVQLFLYNLGDLDDFYWPMTTCFGIQSGGKVDQVVLLYRGEGLPVLLALSQPGQLNEEYLADLFQLLPKTFYAHFSPGVEKAFKKTYTFTDHGGHFKMGLQDFSRISDVNTDKTISLTKNNLGEIEELFLTSYLDNAFDPRMLLSGQYFGCRHKDKLISVGGVHVYSPSYGVAALGNITTHPEFRNRGFGKAVTAKLCSSLSENIDVIGLNVKQDNLPALSLYQSLGFKISSEYGEFTLKNRN